MQATIKNMSVWASSRLSGLATCCHITDGNYACAVQLRVSCLGKSNVHGEQSVCCLSPSACACAAQLWWKMLCWKIVITVPWACGWCHLLLLQLTTPISLQVCKKWKKRGKNHGTVVLMTLKHMGWRTPIKKAELVIIWGTKTQNKSFSSYTTTNISTLSNTFAN